MERGTDKKTTEGKDRWRADKRKRTDEEKAEKKKTQMDGTNDEWVRGEGVKETGQR